MKQALFILCSLFIIISCKTVKETTSSTIKYPETYKDESAVDTYHGKEIKDPYRWLEDDNSAETKDWVQRQNAVTSDYMSKIPFRDVVRKRMEEVYNYERYSSPFKEGNYYYYFKNDGLQNQSVMYRANSLEDEGEVFFDPNTLSEDGTISLGNISMNKDATLMAYSINKAGSDWQEMFVRDLKTGKDLADHIEWAKFSGIAWKGDGFFYSRYPEPAEGDELSSANKGMMVYYHKVGTNQSEDVLVYKDPENPSKYFGAGTTEDERFMSLSAGVGTSGNDLHVKDLNKEDAELVMIKPGMESDAYIIGNRGDDIFMMTNDGAPNWQLVKLNLDNPTKWTTLIPENKNLLESVSMSGGKLLARYQEDVKSKIYQFNEMGKLEREVDLPGLGNVGGFGGKDDATDLFYSFTSYTQPSAIYYYNIENGKSTLYRKPNVDFDADDYETKQVFYASKDGTKVPMYIVHKKGIKLDGNNPTLLYGYGGFNISIKPGFSSVRQVWLENGGVYAVPNLRGGGEYGTEWHDGGRLLNKQNVFDDFIAAAEYLIDEGYTKKEKLAINGRSNGGLLVGAAMTQRPDLFAVAIPGVGVMDMLKYEQFTIGYAWATDYGSVKEKEHFENLLSYSPLHNLKDGVEYPATIIHTADHDDRVVPAHSFKFASRLQEAHKGNDAVLIRIDVDAGHGAGKPTSKILDEWADLFSFTMHNVGLTPKGGGKVGN